MRSRIVLAACLAAFVATCPGCREESPPQSQRNRVESSSRPDTTATREKVSVNWRSWLDPWLKDPPCLKGLTAEQRTDVERAQGAVSDSYELWRHGRLDVAEADIKAARATFVRIFGEQHWKIWDCDLALALMDVERAVNPEELRKVRVEHTYDIPGSLSRAARYGDVTEAPQRIDELCDFLDGSLGEDYALLTECYRHLFSGDIAAREQRLAEARERYEKAFDLALSTLPPNHPLVAIVRTELARALLHADPGDIGAARVHIDAALSALRDAVRPTGTYAWVWGELLSLKAKVLASEQRLDEAAKALEAAIAAYYGGSRPNDRVLAGYLRDLAQLNNRVGDYGTALRLLEEEQRVRQVSDKQLASMFEEMGISKVGLGAFQDACAHFKTSLAIACDKSIHQSCWRTHYYYGLTLTKEGRFDEALSQFDLGDLGMMRPEHLAWSKYYRARAKVLRALRNDKHAELPPLISHLTNIENLDETGERWRFRFLARVAAMLGQMDDAIRWSNRAIEFYENAPEAGQVDVLDLGYFHEKESPYLLAAILSAQQGQHDGAWMLGERHSAKMLRALLARSDPQTSDTPSSSPSEILDDLRLDNATAVLGWLEDVPDPGVPPLPHRWAFVVRGGGCEWVPLKQNYSENRVMDLPAGVVQALRNRDSDAWLKQGYALYLDRFQAVMEHLEGVTRLYVLNRGLMLTVPVDALPVEDPDQADPPQLLGDRFTVAYVPSCIVLSQLLDRYTQSAARLRSVLVVGDPVFDKNTIGGRGLRPLRAARHEAEVVAKRFTQSEARLGDRASEAELYDMNATGGLRSFDVLHFVTHAYSDQALPDRCGLMLTATMPSELLAALTTDMQAFGDGMLDFCEIQKLQVGANLVVLSACETSVGRPLESEGYLGLPHAFFAAGTRSLVTTLWKVDDLASAILMDRFYGNLIEENMTKGNALWEAKKHLRTLSWNDVISWCQSNDARELADERFPSTKLAYAHPRFWAGTILIGPQD